MTIDIATSATKLSSPALRPIALRPAVTGSIPWWKVPYLLFDLPPTGRQTPTRKQLTGR